MTALLVPGAEVQVGDDLMFLGRPHRITAIEPYDASVLGILTPGVRTARSSDGWAMTLFPQQRCAVERVTG